MGNTPVYDLPYPESTDPPNGPAQMRALAEATEKALRIFGPVVDIRSGAVLVPKADPGKPVTVPVTFDTPLSGGNLLTAQVTAWTGAPENVRVTLSALDRNGVTVASNRVTSGAFTVWWLALAVNVSPLPAGVPIDPRTGLLEYPDDSADD